MDLWIRSQSKLSLIKANNICIDRVDDDIKIVAYNNSLSINDYLILGKYKSEKRALEVLDKINKILDDADDNGILTFIYQMPKE